MPRYIAFLRGINVGGHRVKMDRLREIFRALDFSNVETFIASGNVLFDAPAEDARTLEAEIEHHLGSTLGYAVETFIRTPQELAAIVGHAAFPAANADGGEHTLSIVLLKAPPDEELAGRLLGLRTADDEFHIHSRELYWLCRSRISDSPASAPLGKALWNNSGTMRNATTLRKLTARFQETA